MVKPLINIRLSYEMQRTLEQMTLAPGVTKSAIVEDALRAYLDPTRTGGREQALMTRLDQFDLRQGAIERDLALCLETLGQYVLYWLTRTDPLPQDERGAAQTLGQRRFDFFIEQVVEKISSDSGLTSQLVGRNVDTPDGDKAEAAI
jgi:hypothetical protein